MDKDELVVTMEATLVKAQQMQQRHPGNNKHQLRLHRERPGRNPYLAEEATGKNDRLPEIRTTTVQRSRENLILATAKSAWNKPVLQPSTSGGFE